MFSLNVSTLTFLWCNGFICMKETQTDSTVILLTVVNRIYLRFYVYLNEISRRCQACVRCLSPLLSRSLCLYIYFVCVLSIARIQELKPTALPTSRSF